MNCRQKLFSVMGLAALLGIVAGCGSSSKPGVTGGSTTPSQSTGSAAERGNRSTNQSWRHLLMLRRLRKPRHSFAQRIQSLV